MAYRVRFTGQQQVDIEEYQPQTPAAGQVQLKTLYSLMSTGTEGIVYRRLFDPGTGFDKWVKYPFYPGYSNIGKIVALGEGVTGLKVGQAVASRQSHVSDFTLPADMAFPVAEGIDLKQASWFALAKIASHGARAAQHTLGQMVAVVGAGPVGQMAIRWAAACGAEAVVAVDPVEHRLELAQRGGATATVALPVDQAKDAVWAACPVEGGPDVVIDATGHAGVFTHALALPRKGGRFVLLGTPGAADLQLPSGSLFRPIQVTGVHDMHNDERWNNATATRAFYKLVAAGRFPLGGLISHEFSPRKAKDAYELAVARRAETMGILFDWT